MTPKALQSYTAVSLCFCLSVFVQRSDQRPKKTRNSCVFLCVCVFFSPSPVFPLLSLRMLSSGDGLPFLIHFWDLRPILPNHPCVIPIPPSSLSLFSLSLKLNCRLFAGSSQSSHTLAILCPPPPTFYFILIFYIIAQNIFSIPPLVIPFAVFPYHLSLSAPITLLSLFSWQALPTDVAAYVALTGPKQRAACARSGWLQVTSVFINSQIPSSIWEQSRDRGREGGEEERERQRERYADRRRKCFVSFTLVHEAGHAICHVLSLLHH